MSAKQALSSVGAGVGTGAIAIGGGQLANKLGILDPQTVLAGGALPKGLSKEAFKNALKGAVSEGALQELPQSAQEQMWQNYGLDKPLLEGVPEAAATGLLAGGVMGVGANLAHSRGGQVETIQDPIQPNDDTLPQLRYDGPPLRLGYDGLPSAPDVIHQGTDQQQPKLTYSPDNSNNPDSSNFNSNINNNYDPVIDGLTRQASQYGMPTADNAPQKPTGTVSKALATVTPTLPVSNTVPNPNSVSDTYDPVMEDYLRQNNSNTVLEGELVDNIPDTAQQISEDNSQYQPITVDNLPELFEPASKAKEINIPTLKDLIKTFNIQEATPKQIMRLTGSNAIQAGTALRQVKQEREAIRRDYNTKIEANRALNKLADKTPFEIGKLANDRYAILPKGINSVLPKGYVAKGNAIVAESPTRPVTEPNARPRRQAESRTNLADIHNRVTQGHVNSIADSHQGNISPMDLASQSGGSYSQALESLRRYTPQQEVTQQQKNTNLDTSENNTPTKLQAVSNGVTEPKQVTVNEGIISTENNKLTSIDSTTSKLNEASDSNDDKVTNTNKINKEKANKIEDFGEKIEGAKKDFAKRLSDAKDMDISNVPLSDSLPEPNYDQLIKSGVPSVKVDLFRALRDSVPSIKPRGGHELRRWTTKVASIRELFQRQSWVYR